MLNAGVVGVCVVPCRFSETAALEAHSGEREKSGTAPSQLYRICGSGLHTSQVTARWCGLGTSGCQPCFSKQGASLGSSSSLPWELSDMQTRGARLGGTDYPNLKLRSRDQPSVCSWTLQVTRSWLTVEGSGSGFSGGKGRRSLDLPPEKGGNRPLF